MSSVVWTQEVDDVLCSGVSLSQIGSNNWAFSRNDAIKAVLKIRNLGYGIAGGDVFRFDGVVIAPIYADWCCELGVGEGLPEFSKRSADVAISFIENFPEDDVLYSIVPALLEARH